MQEQTKLIDPNTERLRQMASDMQVPLYHVTRDTNQYFNDSGHQVPEPEEIPGLGVQSVVMEWPNRKTLPEKFTRGVKNLGVKCYF